MMGYQLIVPPAVYPVTLAEAKAQCRVDHDDEDAFIQRLIAAATGHFDARSGVLGRCLISQTWEMVLDEFPAGALELPLGPVQSVVSVEYDDPSGVAQTVAASTYTVDTTSLSAWVVPDGSWPPTLDNINAVRVRFVSGYGSTPAAVPDAIRHAILMLIGHWYENREAVAPGSPSAPLPMAVDALVAPYRVHGF
jgi:uncharacterized phiE125 gp8 family phage protein